MNNVGEQLNLVINNLAEKLGVAADKLYPMLIKQAYIDGIISLIWIAVGLLLLIGNLYLINRYYIQDIEVERHNYIERVKRSENWEEEHVAFWIISIITLLLGIIMSVGNVNNCITALNNPEWYAIKTILNR